MLFSFIRSALILWITLCLSCLLRHWESSWLMRRDSLSLELRPDLDLPPQTDSSCSWSRRVYVVFYWHQQIFRSRRYVWAGTSHSGFMLARTHGFITAAVLNTCCEWDSVQLSHQLHNCLWLCLPHTEVYCTFSPAVWGLCGTQSSSLSAHSLCPVTDYSRRFLFLWLRPFFPCTVERSSQGRARGGPAKGLEGNWVFSYHSRHSTHIPLLQGPVTSVHASQEALTRSQPHIVPLLSSASTEFIHT